MRTDTGSEDSFTSTCLLLKADVVGGGVQVILVNSETASTSEILTGALHAHGRALTAGAHTFGKGRTRVLPMRDGSTLLVSASLITTPAHEVIDKACRMR